MKNTPTSGQTLTQNCMKAILKSRELVKVLREQKKVNEDIANVHKELVEADKKHKALQFKMQRLKDKGVKLLDKAIKEQAVMMPLDYTGALKELDSYKVEVEIHNLFNDNFSDLKAIEQRLLEDKKNKTGMWSDPLMFTGHKE